MMVWLTAPMECIEKEGSVEGSRLEAEQARSGAATAAKLGPTGLGTPESGISEVPGPTNAYHPEP